MSRARERLLGLCAEKRARAGAGALVLLRSLGKISAYSVCAREAARPCPPASLTPLFVWAECLLLVWCAPKKMKMKINPAADTRNPQARLGRRGGAQYLLPARRGHDAAVRVVGRGDADPARARRKKTRRRLRRAAPRGTRRAARHRRGALRLDLALALHLREPRGRRERYGDRRGRPHAAPVVGPREPRLSLSLERERERHTHARRCAWPR